jgi:hypothetical protein
MLSALLSGLEPSLGVAQIQIAQIDLGIGLTLVSAIMSDKAKA